VSCCPPTPSTPHAYIPPQQQCWTSQGMDCHLVDTCRVGACSATADCCCCLLLAACCLLCQGSGWGWLGYNKASGALDIVTCANQDPLAAKVRGPQGGGAPVLLARCVGGLPAGTAAR
jgi:hypothetical protein